MAVACGYNQSAAVSEDGFLFFCGEHQAGLIGCGDAANKHDAKVAVFTQAQCIPAPVLMVSLGSVHTGIVTDEGELFMCGRGNHGILGVGDLNGRDIPTRIPKNLFHGEAVLMVACRYTHTAVLTQPGMVYTFGNGKNGRLGHGDEVDQLSPKRVDSLFTKGVHAVMIAAGVAHTVALDKDGNVFTWGNGGKGRLGHNDEQNQLEPVEVNPACFGGRKITFISANGLHNAAVTAEGLLFTWGLNASGQLGHNDNTTRFTPTLMQTGPLAQALAVMAACGVRFTLVVTRDGGLWATGCNEMEQLGLGDFHDRFFFHQVGLSNGFSRRRVTTAAAGRHHSAVVTSDGEIWTWGAGCEGELGHGVSSLDTQFLTVPTRVQGFDEEHTRIGRFVRPRAEQTLPVLMSLHTRLGAQSLLSTLSDDSIEEIINSLVAVPGRVRENRSLMTLLGFANVPRLRMCRTCNLPVS